MKQILTAVFCVLTFNAHASFLYVFEEIELFNPDDHTDSALLSGLIEYDNEEDINNDMFSRLEFLFTYDGNTVTFTDFDGLVIDNLDDGIFGNGPDENTGEGFEVIDFKIGDLTADLFVGDEYNDDSNACVLFSNANSEFCSDTPMTILVPESRRPAVSEPSVILTMSLALLFLARRRIAH